MSKPGKGEWELFRKAVWDKESFLELGTDARLLYFWTWTSPASSLSGLFEASPRKMLTALGRSPGADAYATSGEMRLRDALEELARKPLVLYDDEAEVVWVVGRVDHSNLSPTTAIRIRREWEACPRSPLKDQFAAAYGSALGLTQGGTTP